MKPSPQHSKLLVTGTTGYVGGRLVPKLLQHGHRVRVLARQISQLEGRPWREQVEITPGDVLEPSTLAQAFSDITTAYYLIPRLGFTADGQRKDLEAACNFGKEAFATGVKRIIYLGGLGEPCSQMSNPHRSRLKVGDTLRESGVPVTEFRSTVIIGCGSTTFEMIRYLNERMPIILLPSWGYSRIQPISIRDVLDYLVSALDKPQSLDEVIDIGGSEILTFADMMRVYARVRGLRRFQAGLPIKIPRFSAYWTHLTTPLPVYLAQRLINDLCNDVLLQNDSASELFPEISPVGYEEAVASALTRLNAGDVETSWTDANYFGQKIPPPVKFHNQEGMAYEQRQTTVAASSEEVFNIIVRLGGQHGWLFMNWAWRLRGMIDRISGGVGLQRGRRDPDDLRVGDALDFWRVEAIETNRLLRLRAEMKLPGQAWLQFEATPLSENQTVLRQTAFFAPKGLSGNLYWYTLYPIHKLIFIGMLRKIAEKAEALHRTTAISGEQPTPMTG